MGNDSYSGGSHMALCSILRGCLAADYYRLDEAVDILFWFADNHHSYMSVVLE
jgi:hypothetical protein